eukprot:5927158-Amphidinium_carterae.1
MYDMQPSLEDWQSQGWGQGVQVSNPVVLYCFDNQSAPVAQSTDENAVTWCGQQQVVQQSAGYYVSDYAGQINGMQDASWGEPMALITVPMAPITLDSQPNTNMTGMVAASNDAPARTAEESLGQIEQDWWSHMPENEAQVANAPMIEVGQCEGQLRHATNAVAEKAR